MNGVDFLQNLIFQSIGLRCYNFGQHLSADAENEMMTMQTIRLF